MRRLVSTIAVSALGLAAIQTASATEIMQVVMTSAPPAKVWSLIRDFDSIATWLPPAKSSPADHGDSVGSVRVITLRAPGDPTVTEKLTALDDARPQLLLRYRQGRSQGAAGHRFTRPRSRSRR